MANMSIDLYDEILQDFLVEAGEIIELLSEQLVELEQSPEDIEILKETYNYIYDNSLNVTQARKIIESKLDHNVHVQNVLNFLSRSKRGLVGK